MYSGFRVIPQLYIITKVQEPQSRFKAMGLGV